MNTTEIHLEELKQNKKVFKENAGASIIDIGDRIGLVEFHTKANSLNDDVCNMLIAASQETAFCFDALVIGNRGKHFSAGANLAYILETAREEKWSVIEQTIAKLQTASMTLKYGPLPVVAAPFSNALGGGCEVCLHSARVVIAEGTHLGLVETGVGLIPAGGGTKELGLRATDRATGQGIANGNATATGDPVDAGLTDTFPALWKVFESITRARVSPGGAEAKEWFLGPTAVVTPGNESPIELAKTTALELVYAGYRNPDPRKKIPALGSKGLTVFQDKIAAMLDQKSISEHDALIGRHVATILCGGSQPAGEVNEQHFLDLEREAFLSLLGTTKTQERIEFLLKNNKPLHN
jgi:3-hydroxyacyl-CoA dehydrogenase